MEDIRFCGRNTQGVRVMKLAEGSQVIGVARADKEEETDENTVDEDEERTRAMQEASGTGLDMDLGGEEAPSQEPKI